MNVRGSGNERYSVWRQRSNRHALNAPGSTVMYPNMLFDGLSKIFDISYSKFCAATRALIRYGPYVPFRAMISPPIFELMSNAFQRWYTEVWLGIAPTSSRIHMLGRSSEGVEEPAMKVDFSFGSSLRRRPSWHLRFSSKGIPTLRTRQEYVGWIRNT